MGSATFPPQKKIISVSQNVPNIFGTSYMRQHTASQHEKQQPHFAWLSNWMYKEKFYRVDRAPRPTQKFWLQEC